MEIGKVWQSINWGMKLIEKIGFSNYRISKHFYSHFIIQNFKTKPQIYYQLNLSQWSTNKNFCRNQFDCLQKKSRNKTIKKILQQMRSERNRNKKQLSLRNRQKKVWRQEAEKSVWTINGNGQQTIKKSRKNIKFQCLMFFERSISSKN